MATALPSMTSSTTSTTCAAATESTTIVVPFGKAPAGALTLTATPFARAENLHAGIGSPSSEPSSSPVVTISGDSDSDGFSSVSSCCEGVCSVSASASPSGPPSAESRCPLSSACCTTSACDDWSALPASLSSAASPWAACSFDDSSEAGAACSAFWFDRLSSADSATSGSDGVASDSAAFSCALRFFSASFFFCAFSSFSSARRWSCSASSFVCLADSTGGFSCADMRACCFFSSDTWTAFSSAALAASPFTA